MAEEKNQLLPNLGGKTKPFLKSPEKAENNLKICKIIVDVLRRLHNLLVDQKWF
jgi:hypothetical protein